MENKEEGKKNIKKEILEWGFCIVIAYVIYLFVNYYLIAISGVKQTSMTNTAMPGEKLFITRTILFEEELEFQDIITFTSPNFNQFEKNEYSYPIQCDEAIADYNDHNFFESFLFDFVGIGKKSYIKRVIGLEGDHIEINKDGSVYRNGEKLEEDYIKDGTTSITGDFYNVIVPEDTIFVMGDNRLGSLDSRSFGCIPVSKVEGYVKIRVWPFNKWGEL